MKWWLGVIFSLMAGLAQALDAGEPLQRASKAYLAQGADAFIPALLEGSPMEGEAGVLAQSQSLHQVESFYGAYQGFDVIYEKPLTARVRLVYYIMNYENSPLFAVATYYRRASGEIVTHFNFNTKMWDVLPSDVVFR
ncbi:hypothetical protein [Aestuariirhabdus litorea]|uniref:DUF3887 domain-containing protein n=1 Tax=Aestuariirhabdus litorea TaxID=2528527 RepID=A0A3P3VPC5_9GAMM|nr:hypothetical protein [Aestuariirhabdus litorea]RRJ83768.1 hypothetical protein D0544_01205 [Aestuariirhabdus litorea]RWW96991.1 hypothetical protein DZC74_01205 [Endozoicomonadaceae bacterium GTF-13]